MKKLILFSLLFFNSNLFAQEFGTKAQEFWLTYMENLDLGFNGDPQFSIFVAADASGTATITAPATGFTVSFDYEANTTTDTFYLLLYFMRKDQKKLKILGLELIRRHQLLFMPFIIEFSFQKQP